MTDVAARIPLGAGAMTGFSAVHANPGDGGFGEGTTLALGAGSMGLVDLGQDGLPDVWMARTLHSDRVQVESLRNQGDLGFVGEGTLVLEDVSGSGFVADVDGDWPGAEFVFLLNAWAEQRAWLSVHSSSVLLCSN